MPRNRQPLNNEGRYTLLGIYLHVKEGLNKDYRAALSKNNHRKNKRISLETFSSVVRKYLIYCVKDSIDSFFGVEWFSGSGTLRVVSFIPKKKPWRIRYKAGKKHGYTTINLNRKDGYFSYLRLITTKRNTYNKVKLKLDRMYKKKITYNLYQQNREYYQLQDNSCL
jgi:hypothetical protein